MFFKTILFMLVCYRNPSKEPRPESIVNDTLLCKEHVGLLFEPPSNLYSTEQNP